MGLRVLVNAGASQQCPLPTPARRPSGGGRDGSTWPPGVRGYTHNGCIVRMASVIGLSPPWTCFDARARRSGNSALPTQAADIGPRLAMCVPACQSKVKWPRNRHHANKVLTDEAPIPAGRSVQGVNIRQHAPCRLDAMPPSNVVSSPKAPYCAVSERARVAGNMGGWRCANRPMASYFA